VIAVEVLFERVAGLDVGKQSLTVCVRTPGPGSRRVSETRTVKTTTRALGVMRDWLRSSGVTIAAMESTSSYWKAPFYCLEEVMEVWLLNAAHMKAVPGRRPTSRTPSGSLSSSNMACCGPRSCLLQRFAGCGCSPAIASS
jgi:hypothetical protein